ncbi:hypothetical protein [Nocardioides bruguierae]|uniref:Uncharacterized protein n=1 Tax=Nocardioides bruguierae TaxID=2945102 RepID=A0A9X2IHD5_9ACTN|nr:hypothetical protein [Nocardioides bruguierae]MCM0622494.1 hypothetical protein [Nocardioides bruguierae]
MRDPDDYPLVPPVEQLRHDLEQTRQEQQKINKAHDERHEKLRTQMGCVLVLVLMLVTIAGTTAVTALARVIL